MPITNRMDDLSKESLREPGKLAGTCRPSVESSPLSVCLGGDIRDPVTRTNDWVTHVLIDE